jgi:hypothetical protein
MHIESSRFQNAAPFAGAANARLAVFVGTPGADLLFRRLSGSIPHVCDVGAKYDVTAKAGDAGSYVIQTVRRASFRLSK